MEISAARLQSALAKAAGELLSARNEAGHWVGELSSSALSTATAVTALAITQRESKFPIRDFKLQISSGLEWLAKNVNADGGWGDTTKSLSNLSTTTLCWAAFGATQADEKFRGTVHAAECWLRTNIQRSFPAQHSNDATHFTPALVAAVLKRYDEDRTFSVPILTMCALSGRLGSNAEAWEKILPLPFEMAALPRATFGLIGLPVVSYALPALIAIGYARHFHAPSKNLFVRALRNGTRDRTLKILGQIQPGSGGFLEATPLTSFVVMSLAGSGQVEHQVVEKGLEFLLRSQRCDGSWPIDTNLATWLTTLSINALKSDSPSAISNLKLEISDHETITAWLLQQQFRSVHTYTNAAPGGWAWTDLPGGVPDADDTAGALLALKKLQVQSSSSLRTSVEMGIRWLLDLQNRDGGIPTFCRGWGKLAFDRSSPDLTAHAIRAWLAWLGEFPEHEEKILRAVERALTFLYKTQRPDGAWVPLWFGNQFSPSEENLNYGTSRVLLALIELSMWKKISHPQIFEMLDRGAGWLLKAQNADGSWSGFSGGPASIEETSWAVESLAAMLGNSAGGRTTVAELRPSVLRGVNWLLEKIESGEWKNPTPVGFYFARLWYFEKLYPQIFTVAALRSVERVSK